MKWGRKKLPSESSSSRPLISHVLPVSWLSKFKQKSRDVEVKQVKVKQEGKQSSAFAGAGDRGGRFYAGEGDMFWRLSFGEDDVQEKTSRGNFNSVWYDSHDKLHVPTSVCQSCESNKTTLMGNEEIHRFNNLILDARKMRELPREVQTWPEMDIYKSEKDAVTKTPRITAARERKLKKINQRGPEEKWSKLEQYPNEAKEKSRKSNERDNSHFEPLETIPVMARQNCKLTSTDLKKHRYVSSADSRYSKLKTVEEDGVLAAQDLIGNYGISAEKMSSEWKRLKEMKIRELKLRSENQRKSIYISRELQTRKTGQNSKVKVGSPRIKALEDMKKAKMKMKKGKEKTTEDNTGLESFAVVKCSFDPQKDFTDSMIEMIMEKKFSQPEELEELLACYLTLNSDEYHDLIIKVFRQVWLELNQVCFDESQNEH